MLSDTAAHSRVVRAAHAPPKILVEMNHQGPALRFGYLPGQEIDTRRLVPRTSPQPPPALQLHHVFRRPTTIPRHHPHPTGYSLARGSDG